MTKDGVGFRSLGNENHQTVVFGEIFFGGLASNLGVYALEVKVAGSGVRMAFGFTPTNTALSTRKFAVRLNRRAKGCTVSWMNCCPYIR